MKVLLTGATGFIGSHLLSALGDNTVILSRKPVTNYLGPQFYCDLEKNDFERDAFRNVDVVIHCAARAHIMNDSSSSPLELYRVANTIATHSLAKVSAEMGVKRFIYISSIKVNGESTDCQGAFKASDIPNPEDDYGISKSEAESHLMVLGKERGMEIVIIRPPLVYGPGVKASFAALMNVASKGVPLPFGLITNNRRSLVSITNLVDLVIRCVEHPNAANQVFLVSDDHDFSTTKLVKNMYVATNKNSCLFPVPIWCFKLIGKLTGKSEVISRLVGSLHVDISKTKELLDWTPPQSTEAAFKQVADTFNKRK
ncbi:UDP-glucose 4-epimerase family protein [Pseudomonadota bacterium]